MTGLRTWTDDGLLQFDSSDPAYVLIHAGTAAYTTASTSFGRTEYVGLILDIVAPYVAPVAFVRSRSGHHALGILNYDASRSTKILVALIANPGGGAVSGELEYYVFDRMSVLTSLPGPALSPGGLRVFGAGGDLHYHSDAKPMRIAASLTSPPAPMTLPGSGKTFAAGGAGCVEWGDAIPGASNPIFYFPKLVGHSLTFTKGGVGGLGFGLAGAAYFGSLMIADVSGYL